MKNWKIPAGCAVFAFIIAVLAGLLGSVSFGKILLRAAVSSVGFGAVMYGIMLVIHSRLPELYGILTSSAVLEDEQGGVDIIISDDDEPVDTAAAAETEPGLFEGESFAEEVNELSGAVAEDTEQEQENEKGLGELESADEKGNEPQELGDIEDGFEKHGNTGELSDISGKEADVVEVLGEFQDPHDVARAVQTIMKRDEE